MSKQIVGLTSPMHSEKCICCRFGENGYGYNFANLSCHSAIFLTEKVGTFRSIKRPQLKMCLFQFQINKSPLFVHHSRQFFCAETEMNSDIFISNQYKYYCIPVFDIVQKLHNI